MDYTLKLNEAHIAVLIAALDMYGRVGTGEFTTILGHPDVSKAFAGRNPSFSHNVRMLLDHTVKSLVYSEKLGPGSYYPPGSPELGDTNRVAFDILQVLLHRIALDTSVPNAAFVVQPDDVQPYDERGPTSKQPLVTIEKLS